MVAKHEIINHLIKEKGFKNYLEIGIDNPDNCFNLIECQNKTGVDPYSAPLQPHIWQSESREEMIAKIKGNFVEKTSDAFFETLPNNEKFDIIFIDGLHLEYQVLKDIENSLNHLSEGGYIILHDCLPNSYDETVENPTPEQGWMGTVFLAFAKLRCERNDLFLRTIDTDCGLGVITMGKNKPYKCRVWKDKLVLSYEYYSVYRNDLMNGITVEQFLNEGKNKGCKGCKR
jgi:hypothetical protein